MKWRVKRGSLTWLVIAHRCGLQKSLWWFLSWNCTFYIICMDACPRVHVFVLSASHLKGLCSSNVQKWAKSGVERAELICAYLGKDRVPTWLLPISWSTSNRIRAAPGFYNLQIALAAFFSLWLRRNGSFFVMFSKLGAILGSSDIWGNYVISAYVTLYILLVWTNSTAKVSENICEYSHGWKHYPLLPVKNTKKTPWTPLHNTSFGFCPNLWKHLSTYSFFYSQLLHPVIKCLQVGYDDILMYSWDHFS